MLGESLMALLFQTAAAFYGFLAKKSLWLANDTEQHLI